MVISDIADCHKMPYITVVNGICIRTSFQRGVRTSKPAIFAVGDCNDSGPNLTPVSAFEGPIAAKNLLAGKYEGTAPVDRKQLTGPIAGAGLTHRIPERLMLPVITAPAQDKPFLGPDDLGPDAAILISKQP